MALALEAPIVGESVYQPKQQMLEDRSWCPRMFLHSYALGFPDLTGLSVRRSGAEGSFIKLASPDTHEWHCVVTPLSKDLQEVVSQLEPLDAASAEVRSSVLASGLISDQHGTCHVIGNTEREELIDSIYFPYQMAEVGYSMAKGGELRVEGTAAHSAIESVKPSSSENRPPLRRSMLARPESSSSGVKMLAQRRAELTEVDSSSNGVRSLAQRRAVLADSYKQTAGRSSESTVQRKAVLRRRTSMNAQRSQSRKAAHLSPQRSRSRKAAILSPASSSHCLPAADAVIRSRGFVKSYSANTAFGFIVSPDSDRDVFFHLKNCEGSPDWLERVGKGPRINVEFDLDLEDQHKPKAIGIRALDDDAMLLRPSGLRSQSTKAAPRLTPRVPDQLRVPDHLPPARLTPRAPDRPPPARLMPRSRSPPASRRDPPPSLHGSRDHQLSPSRHRSSRTTPAHRSEGTRSSAASREDSFGRRSW